MPKRYTLSEKITALNLIDQLNGDRRQAADQLNIPRRTLEGWLPIEDQLRNQFTSEQDGQFDRQLRQVHLKLLDRALAILDCLDDSALADASASQLARALNAILSQTVKLQELQNHNDQIPATIPQPTSIDFGQHAETHTAPPESD